MATTLSEIKSFLERRGLEISQCREDHACVEVMFNIQSAGHFRVVIHLEEAGRILKLFVPELFHYKEGRFKLLVMETLLVISWETRFLQWEFDHIDGEIRAIIEFPLEDANLTEKQFFRAFDNLVELVRVNYFRVKSVMETGEEPARPGRSASRDDLVGEFLKFLKRSGAPPNSSGDVRDEEDDIPDEI